ncbi:hypothetical protein BY996DRAFT_4574100 [Phakopsora pachyrhizi]|uniref:Cyclin N-terminal domain-containing protein n=1 Tax=Phakopsora pachyrhizi TaxID=170000 RepID=A0AAV0AJC3_PHAPC|nr:hypothetical protein BY996DRAFT_4574100 [Phakopsora pachyrhizi]CAH7668593.1 hypothetical protein PPACK8108_LOCUS3113 [Phakopsora pachyrhizi]
MNTVQRKNASASAGSDSSSSTPSLIPSQMQRRHPASLIPRHMHNPILLGLLKAPVNDELIEYVAECTLSVVSTPSDTAQLPTPPTTPVKSNFRQTISRTFKQTSGVGAQSKEDFEFLESSNASNVPSLTTFIKIVSARANAQAPTLLVTLVYIDRLRHRLKGAKAAKGMQSTYHRLFLACLIAAAKFCNDCCPRNVHWVKWSGLFTLVEVNLMEQELLMLLDYDLRVEEEALLQMCAPFMPPCSQDKTTTMDRQSHSLASCSTARTLSSDGSQEDLPTPLTSPVSIRLDSSRVVSSTYEHEKKKLKITESAANSTVTVITRAKSWYGSLRAAAS